MNKDSIRAELAGERQRLGMAPTRRRRTLRARRRTRFDRALDYWTERLQGWACYLLLILAVMYAVQEFCLYLMRTWRVVP